VVAIPLLLLLLLLFLLLLVFLLLVRTRTTSVPSLAARSFPLAFLFFTLLPLLLVQGFDLVPGQTEVALAASETSGSPVEQGSAAFVVDDDFGAVDFAVAGALVGGHEVILAVELDEAVAS
jgi:hypothetical protein